MDLLGLDIGFGGVKFAHGGGGDSTVGVLPVGAAPIGDLMRGPVTGAPVLGEGESVLVNGVEWGAGVEPLSIERFSRHLSADYPASERYYALFLAVLSRLGTDQVDRLVTGLPVNHHQVPATTQSLRRRLTGEHVLNRAGRKVTVANVIVVPQPAGTYMEAMRLSRLDNAPVRKITRNQLVLVVDPGHFSVDWILLRNGSTLPRSSGSCPLGSKEVLQQAAARISDVVGMRVSAERLDQSVRSGERLLQLGDSEVELAPHLEAAAAPIVDQVVQKVRNALETEEDSVDIALLSGGGAALYQNAISRGLPRSRVWLLDDPVTANARGFYLMAVGQQRSAA